MIFLLGYWIWIALIRFKNFQIYSSKVEIEEIFELYRHPERQILREPNQVRALPKWDLKRVYGNLIWVIDFTLKFTAHDDDLDDDDDEGYGP